MDSQSSRRRILQGLMAVGVGSKTMCRMLADEVSATGNLTVEQVAAAEKLTGLDLSDDERASLVVSIESTLEKLRRIRAQQIPVDQSPAVRFDPEIGSPETRQQWQRLRPWQRVWDKQAPPHLLEGDSETGVRWKTVRRLAADLRSGVTTSAELTRQCLMLLEQANPALNCVVSLLKDRALAQADQADRELAQGKDRGLLHGIPWGAKDLLAVPGYHTTWGAPQYRDRELNQSATVVSRLDEAGAVLTAKLSTGALAMGDRWFGGQTKNPWNTEQGSSGSSAGSAAATSAGLLPFAIGSETLGSIISPSKRCSIAGLRPTYGRVSRAGCMPLSWTMDKLGPLARSCDDLGIVLAAIHGSDPSDSSSVTRWYEWPVSLNLKDLRVGHVTNAATTAAEQVVLDQLRSLGVTICDIQLPREHNEYDLTVMLDVEAATVFRELTNSGDTEGLNSWPTIFQRARFVSAVDYLQAARVRAVLMQQMAAIFEGIHFYVGGSDLGITNLTGHPTLSVPALRHEQDPQPLCCTLTAGLYDEATLLAAGTALEPLLGVYGMHPNVPGVDDHLQ